MVLPGVPQYWLGCNRFHHGAQSVGDVSGRYFVIRIQQDNGPKARQCDRFTLLRLAQDHSMLMMRGQFSPHEHLVHHSTNFALDLCPVRLEEL